MRSTFATIDSQDALGLLEIETGRGGEDEMRARHQLVTHWMDGVVHELFYDFFQGIFLGFFLAMSR